MTTTHTEGPVRQGKDRTGHRRGGGATDTASARELRTMVGMIVGVGIDVVSIDRVARALERVAEFAHRTYTPGELADCDGRGDRAAALAARFAAKEACFKALGTGWAPGLSWQDIEVRTETDGRPALAVRNGAAERAAQLCATRIHVSLSHDGGVATAIVVLESPGT